MFQHKMSVQQNGFDFRKKRIVAIDVAPAGLHHTDLWISEVMDRTQQKIFRRNKVSVKDRDEFAFGSLHALC